MTFSPAVLAAFAFFREGHESIKQVRKYSGLPYFDNHCVPVASIVAEVTDDEEVIIAAGGHDLIEDVFPLNPYYSLNKVREMFGDRVAGIIFDLTDQYTKENYPQWNRRIRHEKEAERLALISDDAQTVKFVDLIHNTGDITQSDPSFAAVYLKEKMHLLSKMRGGDVRLWKRAYQSAQQGAAKLDIKLQEIEMRE
jgi:(p)ppGpp synthase/HD superfamily hydrolase